MAAGLGVVGCTQQKAELPGPEWPEGDPWLAGSSGRSVPAPPSPPAVGYAGIMPRSAWTSAPPRPSRMNRMLPVRYVTVHHSAGPLFFATDRQTTADRLESIRRFHVEERGWGDIGYHFAVDRAGRVWDCRPLEWQGAHVKDHNEHNVGVMALGDFDRQDPSEAQVAALISQVRGLMATYGVPTSRVRTHQEWAPTACPGRSLQGRMVTARAGRQLA